MKKAENSGAGMGKKKKLTRIARINAKRDLTAGTCTKPGTDGGCHQGVQKRLQLSHPNLKN
jgi:hypothetical protein